MINPPDTHTILAESRRVLLENLVPQLKGDLRYDALMAANALGMAVRELEQQQNGQYGQADTILSAFLETRSLASSPGHGEEDLARAIRERELAVDDVGLQGVLRALTEAQLRINNPAYLDKGR
ncbi:DUF6285 domain-containing protein [Marinobacter fonticola]|uniref:DUF6285 domain-containing protein n=1 Tax=Marinobacter fonticola TaxID=2603215 RepID=UPI0011E694C7|nr:DUF6285 domain-containing protein [Marinobacter fonticola]